MPTNNDFKAKLEELRLPYEQLDVFGVLRLNVHVRVLGRGTAGRWVHALAQLPGFKVTTGRTAWEAVHNKGTCLKPTTRRGYFVHAVSSGA